MIFYVGSSPFLLELTPNAHGVVSSSLLMPKERPNTCANFSHLNDASKILEVKCVRSEVSIAESRLLTACLLVAQGGISSFISTYTHLPISTDFI